MKIPVPEVMVPAAELGRVHFIGVGGAGLSAIARLMARQGVEGSGSDDQDTPFLVGLRELGVRNQPRKLLGSDPTRGTGGTPTRWWCPPPQPRTILRCSKHVGGACGSCRARPGWRP